MTRYELTLTGLSLLFIAMMIGLWQLLGPRPYFLKLVNTGSNSFGAAWVTQPTARGCLLWGQMWRLSIHQTCDPAIAKTHLVNVSHLAENKTYWLLVNDGMHIYWSSIRRVRTYVADVQMNPPRPAYGSVVDVDGNPQVGAVVLVYPKTTGGIYPVATRTNDTGNFVVDLSSFGIGDWTWVLEGGSSLGHWEASSVGPYTTPFPPLEVSSHAQ